MIKKIERIIKLYSLEKDGKVYHLIFDFEDKRKFAKLKKKYTVVVVTHNMQQALRVADDTAFFLVGEMVEFGDTKSIFSYPQDKRTENYITGRFG